MAETPTFLRVIAVLNTDSGTLCNADCGQVATELQAAFTVRGHQIDVLLRSGQELSKALAEAAKDPNCDIVLAGGGDGTISAAAGLCWKYGTALAVLPGGTMNLFARSLRLPLELDAAIRAVAGGSLRHVDIATANGRPFLHQFAVGLHPLIIRTRNEFGYGSRPSKIVASVRAAASVTWDPPSFQVTLKLDDQVSPVEEAAAISIATVPFGSGHMPYADRLDPGHLGIYTARPLSPVEAVRLAKDVMLGTWGDNDCVNQHKARKVELTCSDLWDDAHATIDGEVIALNDPVSIENHPRALRVMFPPTN